MVIRKAISSVGVLALLAAMPLADAQTINVTGPFNFVDTLDGPEAGSNTVVSGVGLVGSPYQFGTSVTVNSINLTSVVPWTLASNAAVQMVNSGYPSLFASVRFSDIGEYTTVSISSPTVRPLWNNTLEASNIGTGSTWSLTFYETYSDASGPDSTGNTLSMTPDAYVAPPPPAQTISVAGPINFVDSLDGPESGSNTTMTGVGVVPIAYQFGDSALVNSINLTSQDPASMAYDASIQMVNSGYPTLEANLACFTVGQFSTVSISHPTQRPYFINSLYGANIAAGSTWKLTFYVGASQTSGTDSVGTNLSFGPYQRPPTEQGNWETFEPLASGAEFNGATGTFTADHVWTYRNNSVELWILSWVTGYNYVFYAQNGARYVASERLAGAGHIDNWLISEEKTLNNGDVISFYSRGKESSNYSDRVYLKLSTSGASTDVEDFTTLLVSINPDLMVGGYPETWTKYSATISGLSGPTSCRFAFQYDVPDSLFNADYIGIDDISITAPGQTLSGNLILGDTAFSGASTRNIAWSVMQGTTNLGSGTIVAGAPSTAMNLAIGAGTGAATLVLDGSSFLKRAVSINLTGSNQAIGNATMQNGDVDNSSEVDAADIDQVIAAFGNMGDNVEDVDVSDEVDAADIDIVIANFGGMDD